MKPVRLPSNQLHRFYRGGPAIASLRGTASDDPYSPEDWVGSTTTVFGQAEEGLSRLADGTILRAAILEDPESFLGPEHVERFGAEPALLLKLLDAGERLPVHCHPERAFARRHLDCPFGKTEAWVVVETEADAAFVHLGFAEDMDAHALGAWVKEQETKALLAALNHLPVRKGDAILVPAGVPHAIGEGVLIVELQEPTDFSVLLEWDGFPIDGETEGHLGLGFDLALECVDRSGWDAARLASLRTSRAGKVAPSPGVEAALPGFADPFFRAEWISPQEKVALDARFSIMVVLEGRGRLDTDNGGALDLARGDTLLIPHAAGRSTVVGEVELIRASPPAPDAPDVSAPRIPSNPSSR